MNAPHGRGETATIYQVCQLFKANPSLCYETITIRKSGHIDIAAEETHGVLMSWSRAMPNHVHREALVQVHYGLHEADVIEADGITVTIRRPGPWGAA